MSNIYLSIFCAIAFWVGGRDWGHKTFRRIAIPIILALYLACALKTWWLFLACGVGYGLTLPIGYGEPTPDDTKLSWLGKVFRVGWLIRGLYGLIVACFGALGLVLGGFIPLTGYFAYLVLQFAVGAILCHFRAPDYIIEPCVGLGIGSVVFFI